MSVEQGALAVINYKWLGCNAADNQNVGRPRLPGRRHRARPRPPRGAGVLPGRPGQHRGQGADHPPGGGAGQGAGDLAAHLQPAHRLLRGLRPREAALLPPRSSPTTASTATSSCARATSPLRRGLRDPGPALRADPPSRGTIRRGPPRRRHASSTSPASSPGRIAPRPSRTRAPTWSRSRSPARATTPAAGARPL